MIQFSCAWLTVISPILPVDEFSFKGMRIHFVVFVIGVNRDNR